MSTSDTDLRVIALDKAVESANYGGGGTTPDAIVAKAQKFYDFLSEKSTDPEGQPLPGEPVNAVTIIDRTAGPHSRACGTVRHTHGSDCNSNCPTCGGK